MKVIVTDKPRTSRDCIFSRVTEDGYRECILNDNRRICNYPYTECDKLEVHNG